MKLEKAKAVHKEILSLIKRHKDLVPLSPEDLEWKFELYLYGLNLRETYGINIDPTRVSSLDWIQLSDYTYIGQYGGKDNRAIPWPDDGSQPDDETLFFINFPTGPYIFGEDYPVDLFQKFFLELKSFNPDYCDSTNKGLYWKLENARKISNEFDSILKKYYKINKEDAKKRRADKLREELAKLES